MKEITGKAIITGDNITTDQICPARYRNGKKAEMVKNLFKDHANLPTGKLNGASVLVAGDGFGEGEDPEGAARALLAGGVSCVVARSFPREFFRPAINEGLALIVADLSGRTKSGEELTINLKKGTVTNGSYEMPVGKYAERVVRIIEHGGLVNALRKELGKE